MGCPLRFPFRSGLAVAAHFHSTIAEVAAYAITSLQLLFATHSLATSPSKVLLQSLDLPGRRGESQKLPPSVIRSVHRVVS